MRLLYIAYDPSYRAITIRNKFSTCFYIVVLNVFLEDSLDHSKYFPEEYFEDDDDICYYHNTVYIDYNMVNINGFYWIEIEWEPEYFTFCIMDKYYYSSTCISRQIGLYHPDIPAKVIWSS